MALSACVEKYPVVDAIGFSKGFEIIFVPLGDNGAKWPSLGYSAFHFHLCPFVSPSRHDLRRVSFPLGAPHRCHWANNGERRKGHTYGKLTVRRV